MIVAFLQPTVLLALAFLGFLRGWKKIGTQGAIHGAVGSVHLGETDFADTFLESIDDGLLVVHSACLGFLGDSGFLGRFNFLGFFGCLGAFGFLIDISEQPPLSAECLPLGDVCNRRLGHGRMDSIVPLGR